MDKVELKKRIDLANEGKLIYGKHYKVIQHGENDFEIVVAPLFKSQKSHSWDALSLSAVIIGVVLFLGLLVILIRCWKNKTNILTLLNPIYWLQGLDNLLKKVCKFALLIFFITLKIFFCLAIFGIVCFGFWSLYQLFFN